MAGYLSYHPNGIQARLQRNKQLHSKWFAYGPNPTARAKRRADRAARQWLKDKNKSLEPRKSELRRPLPHKRNALMRGVTFSHCLDAHNQKILRYQVSWSTGTSRRNKTFTVGPESSATAKDIAVVRKVAEAFRRAYVHSLESDSEFIRWPFDAWRETFGVRLRWRDGRNVLLYPERLERAAAGALRTIDDV